MNIRYITDENGIKTDVIIPIEEWNKIQNNINISVDDIYHMTIDFNFKIIQNSIELFTHILNNTNKNEWEKLFNNSCFFMNKVSANDIGLLYLLRNDKFKYLIKHDDNLSYKLFSEYKIRTLENQPLNDKQIIELKNIIFMQSPSLLVKEFNSKFFIGEKVNIKFRKDAESRRMFIYDILKIFPDYIEQVMLFTNPVEAKEIQSLFQNNSELEEILSQYIYNSNNLTQVQRALKEADERINGNLWKKYLFV